MIIQKVIKQLSIDDQSIENIENIRRVMNKPTKHRDNPLTKSDTRLESLCQINSWKNLKQNYGAIGYIKANDTISIQKEFILISSLVY